WAGLVGGLAFVVGNLVTFGLFGGSRPGQHGLLFDPHTQEPKVITVWKELQPLPRIIESPSLILLGLVAFGVANALLYRSVRSAWPTGLGRRVWRLALVMWLAAAFAELLGPFNVLHQPALLSLLSLAFWAVAAFIGAGALVFAFDRGDGRPLPRAAPPAI